MRVGSEKIFPEYLSGDEISKKRKVHRIIDELRSNPDISILEDRVVIENLHGSGINAMLGIAALDQRVSQTVYIPVIPKVSTFDIEELNRILSGLTTVKPDSSRNFQELVYYRNSNDRIINLGYLKFAEKIGRGKVINRIEYEIDAQKFLNNERESYLPLAFRFGPMTKTKTIFESEGREFDLMEETTLLLAPTRELEKRQNWSGFKERFVYPGDFNAERRKYQSPTLIEAN